MNENPGTESSAQYGLAWLLGALIILLLAAPIVEATEVGTVAVVALFAFLILAMVWGISDRRPARRIAVLLAVGWYAASVTNVIAPLEFLEIVGHILLVLLLGFTITVITTKFITAEKADLDIICGAISVYLLIAILWSSVYRTVEFFLPGSFTGISQGGMQAVEAIYFSFVTLTTLGYGDILPVTRLARIFTSIEAVTGVLYIAVLISRLVSLYRN